MFILNFELSKNRFPFRTSGPEIVSKLKRHFQGSLKPHWKKSLCYHPYDAHHSSGQLDCCMDPQYTHPNLRDVCSWWWLQPVGRNSASGLPTVTLWPKPQRHHEDWMMTTPIHSKMWWSSPFTSRPRLTELYKLYCKVTFLTFKSLQGPPLRKDETEGAYIQQRRLCTALKEEYCFYIGHSWIVRAMVKARTGLNKYYRDEWVFIYGHEKSLTISPSRIQTMKSIISRRPQDWAF